jgi:recombinational DNA repair ATPase RecF
MKLQHLEIKSFRGATQSVKIDFDPKKNTAMIFGENGNGKSTISDALVCLLSDELGSLDDRSTDKKSSYLVSTECAMKDVFIKLATDAGDFTASFSSSGKAVKQPPTGFPNVRQLRRSHITKLIDAQPAKRYEELRSYIDVSKIEASEDRLRELEKELTRTYSSQAEVLASAQETLSQLWEAEQKPGSDYLNWAASEKAKNLKAEETKKNEFKAIINAWEKLQNAAGDIKTKKTSADDAASELLKAVESLEAEQGSGENEQQSLLVLLQKTQTFLEGQTNVAHCPVCTQSVEKNDLSKSIAERLSRMAALSLLMADRDTKQKQSDAANTILENAFQTMDVALSSFAKSIKDTTSNIDKELSNIASQLTVPKTEVRQAYETNLEALSNHIDALIKEVEKAEKTLSQYNAVTIQYDTIIANEAKTKETGDILANTTETLKTVIQCRQKFVEDELNSIAGEVDRIYKILHPNESIGGVKLSLKAGAKASLELSADFHTQKGINPQSLYSESHLDTLGICIFLALANKYNNGDTVLILDDVVMSVDHTHLDRFIDLINQEATKFTHVLLTTHYRPWKDRYKHHRAGSGSMHFVELKPWTLKSGVKIQSFKMDYSDLKQTIEAADFDRQNVAAKAGIFLENMLDFLAIRYRCKLPHSADPRHTLGDYINCFSKKLLPALYVEHLIKDPSTGKFVESEEIVKSPLKDIIDDLKNIAFIRNEVGAHFNLDSQTSDAEVSNFGELTLQLAQLLICPESGSLPIWDKSGSYHHTPNGSIRLHPLKEPS